jgi:hypothetical protein
MKHIKERSEFLNESYKRTGNKYKTQNVEWDDIEPGDYIADGPNVGEVSRVISNTRKGFLLKRVWNNVRKKDGEEFFVPHDLEAMKDYPNSIIKVIDYVDESNELSEGMPVRGLEAAGRTIAQQVKGKKYTEADLRSRLDSMPISRLISDEEKEIIINSAKKALGLNEEGINEATDKFPAYNNGYAPGDYKYMKEIKSLLSKIKGISEYNDMDTTTHVYIKSAPGNESNDLTKEIQKALKGFDDNLDLDNISSNIGKHDQLSPNDQQKGIVTYKIPKKVDWWTLKRAAGPEKPSTETKLTPEIVDSLLDKMASVSTTQHQLANTQWTSLEDFLRSAEDHMSATNYKKFYKEVKKKYPKMH